MWQRRQTPWINKAAAILLVVGLLGVTGLAGPVAAEEKVAVPVFVSVGDAGDYVSVIWEQDFSITGVNVYRNDEWQASVNMVDGRVYNDWGGKGGDTYYLVGYRDGSHSPKSARKTAAVELGRVSAAVSPSGVTVTWVGGTIAANYQVRRQDRGGEIRPGGGTLLATKRGSGSFFDSQAIVGASYAIEGLMPDGTVLPIVTVYPDYEGSLQAHARQACVRCPPIILPPPPGIEPPDNGSPTPDPQTVVDAFNWVDEKIDNMLHEVGAWGSQFVPNNVTPAQLAGQSGENLSGDGYQQDPNTGVWHGPRGETAAVATNGDTTTTTTVTPSWQDPARPATIQQTQMTVKPDGTVVRTDTTITYSYTMEGDPVEAQMTVTEEGKPPKTTTYPNDGGDREEKEENDGCDSDCRDERENGVGNY